jgi:hypothetical protein
MRRGGVGAHIRERVAPVLVTAVILVPPHADLALALVTRKDPEHQALFLAIAATRAVVGPFARISRWRGSCNANSRQCHCIDDKTSHRWRWLFFAFLSVVPYLMLLLVFANTFLKQRFAYKNGEGGTTNSQLVMFAATLLLLSSFNGHVEDVDVSCLVVCFELSFACSFATVHVRVHGRK